MNRLGVCSWSLRPRSPRRLVKLLGKTGVDAVQLALKPFREGGWDPDDVRARLADAGITPRSGMTAFIGEDYSTLASIRATGGLRPDEHWSANLELANADAALAERLGLPLVTFHAGFVPEDPDDPLRGVMVNRLSAVATSFTSRGIAVALETGQEDVATLAGFLDELAAHRSRADVGVNFDPANMLLYGMGDPVAALDRLAPHVRQVHVKDARASRLPGEWGDEVVVGAGEVDWPEFFDVIARRGLDVDLMIEREAGRHRVGEIVAAREFVAPLAASAWSATASGPARAAGRVDVARGAPSPPAAGTTSPTASPVAARTGLARDTRIGIVGLGFMGRTHLAAYRAADAAGFRNRVVAVCDADPERRAGRGAADGNLDSGAAEAAFDPGEVTPYDTPEALLADPNVEAVSICTWTESHVPLALAALAAGKHVLLEKPVSLQSGPAEELLAAARRRPELVVMPAMCMRFWPGWAELHSYLRRGAFGLPRSLRIRRVSPKPGWAPEFYGDPSRCGGALVDLHVHDADFVRWCFGPPRALTAFGDPGCVATRYEFADREVEVVAEGAWLDDPDAVFEMGFEARFEHATLRYEHGAEPPVTLALEFGLLRGSGPHGVPAHSGYDGEVRHFLACVAGVRRYDESPAPADMLADAPGLARLLQAEAESLATGQRVEP